MSEGEISSLKIFIIMLHRKNYYVVLKISNHKRGGEKREDIFDFKANCWILKLHFEVLIPGQWLVAQPQ
jgi:hypothetical protein